MGDSMHTAFFVILATPSRSHPQCVQDIPNRNGRSAMTFHICDYDINILKDMPLPRPGSPYSAPEAWEHATAELAWPRNHMPLLLRIYPQGFEGVLECSCSQSWWSRFSSGPCNTHSEEQPVVCWAYKTVAKTCIRNHNS
ncbi:hypothetical protein LZ32DRAFT_224846 [Colletotrichum eremochloae]|nr:hypothetical protein LZ32DRAFT_224846 [Colletotrichum eremochloae]